MAIVEVNSIGKTGLEMEAFTGVSVALLTIWDMGEISGKRLNRQLSITAMSNIRVLGKQKN